MNRKICLTLIVLLLAALLAGCAGTSKTPAATEAPELTVSPEPAAATAEPTAEPSPEPIRAARVTFDNAYDQGMESARITGYTESGEELWTVLTGSYPISQMNRCTGIGAENGLYYYVEDGRIIALDLTDGAAVWENTDFGGSASGWVFDGDGKLYICGYFGPDVFVVGPDGTTLARVGQFDPSRYWPYGLELEGDALRITYEMPGQTVSVPLEELEKRAGDDVLPDSYDREWVLGSDGLSQLRILDVSGHVVTFEVSFFRLASFVAAVELDDALHTGTFASVEEIEFSGWITFEDQTVTFTVGAAGPFSGDLQGKTYIFVPMRETEEFSITPEELEEQIRLIRQYYYSPGEGDRTVSITAGTDGWEYSREYRFHDGELIFAFIFKGTEEHRLYFKDGHLIRYIDEHHVTYDFGELEPFREWEARALADAGVHQPAGSEPMGTEVRDDWLGSWKSAAGNILEITEVTGTGIRLIHHHTGEQGGMLHTEYFMPFENEQQTVAAEDVDVANTGWRYSLILGDGFITLKSRYPDELFYLQ